MPLAVLSETGATAIMECRMSVITWFGVGIVVAAVLGTVARAMFKKGSDDLGAVSDSWIANHRADPPRD
jgi:hypothetical protein